MFEADLMSAARPCESSGNSSISAKTIFGASLGFTGTLDVLPDVKVSSPSASVANNLIVTTVAVAGAAFNLANISTVLDV